MLIPKQFEIKENDRATYIFFGFVMVIFLISSAYLCDTFGINFADFLPFAE